MMKAIAIIVGLLAISQPASAQSIIEALIGADGNDQRLTTPEELQWKRQVIQEVRDRAPRLFLGRGSVVINFRIDHSGHVSKLKLMQYENNAQALAVASAISSLHLTPPPSSVGWGCCWFTQSFRFH